MSAKPDLYDAWIEFLFDRTKPKWFHEIYEEFEATPEQLVALIKATFERCGNDLVKFSDQQVADGLRYIFYNHASNTIYAICQTGGATERREAAVLAMNVLYRDCLAPRCAPILSHLDEPGGNALNSFCYMLWDVSPLCEWRSVVLDVMRSALALENPACVESALHGLGHRYWQSEVEVAKILDVFIVCSGWRRAELRAYAMAARTGCIQ